MRPLADRIRPMNLDDVVGQNHIIGENKLLNRIIKSGTVPNMIFFGPSGTGKTTVADIIARASNRKFFKFYNGRPTQKSIKYSKINIFGGASDKNYIPAFYVFEY